MAERGDILLEVTVSQLFYFEAKYTNGYPPRKLIREWFRKYDLNVHHAARDGARVGGSKKLVKIRVLASPKRK